MVKTNITSILSACATLKELYDSKNYNSSYQALADFIKYIIFSDKLYSFTASEMKKRLFDVYGFDVPEAVIKTALRNIDFITRANNSYSANLAGASLDETFAEAKRTAESTNDSIIDALVEFVSSHDPSRSVWEDALAKEFIAYLLDDQDNYNNGTYTDLISEFVLVNENNPHIQEHLTAIREGSILYLGLNYNINETGSLRKTLTLFLGTEVLFSLYGFNGEIHKQLAQDMFALIRKANANGEKIRLRYFASVKKEMEDFFTSAASIVEGKMSAFDTVAMKAITNGCETESDVATKQSDFFYHLRYSYGIIPDENDDYYRESLNKYNLESSEFVDPQQLASMKMISDIHKLRKGAAFQDFTDSEYLIVTNTGCTLSLSRGQAESLHQAHPLDGKFDFAVSIDKMTNILWYKLGNGFGNEKYPQNVNVVLKARIILATSISHKITKTYTTLREELSSGKITQEQVAARIISLRKKPILPEELSGDCIDEVLDFSPEAISRVEQEIANTKNALAEKDEIIRKLNADSKRALSEKDTSIAEKDRQLKETGIEKAELEKELEVYRAKERKKQKMWNNIKKWFRFAWTIIWKLLIIAVITCVAIFIEKKTGSTIPGYIMLAADSIGLYLTGKAAIKDDYKKIIIGTEKDSNNHE